MKFLGILTLIFINYSCSLLDSKKLSKDLRKESKKICLDAEGSGRLIIQNHKYIFHFESVLNEQSDGWKIALNIPLYGEEMVEFFWDETGKADYKTFFEERVLKEKKEIDPDVLKSFLENWANLILEVYLLKNQKDYIPKYLWKLQGNKLNVELDEKLFFTNIEFVNVVDDKFFGRYDMTLEPKNGGSGIKLEMIVRKCLE